MSAGSDDKQSLLAPTARSRPFGTSAMWSRCLPVRSSRPPADIGDLKRFRAARRRAGHGTIAELERTLETDAASSRSGESRG